MMITKRYQLKEVASSDIVNIHKGLSNPEITKYYAVHFPTLEATKEQMAWYENLKKEGTGIWFCILDKTNHAFCGAGGYNSLDRENQKAEIGLWLLKEYWGKGILTEVMPKLFDYGFTELGLNRIEGFVDHENSKCKRALEKINFSFEGTMRESEIKNGEKLNVDIYSIIKSDWENTLQ